MVFKIVYEWEVKAVNGFPKFDEDKLYSPTFTGSPDKTVHHWNIFLQWKSENPNYYGVYLCLMDKPFQRSVRVKYFSIKALTAGGETICYLTSTDFYLFEKSSYWGYPNAIDCTKYKIKDINKICVEMELIQGEPTEDTCDQSTHAIIPDLAIFSKLYKSKMWSDLTVVCGNHEIKVHKNILAAKSTVFQAMLESKMQEAASNIIPMHSSNPEALELFFEYLYSGKITIPFEKIAAILDLSEQYDAAELKDFCALEIRQKVAVSNATDLLILADKYTMPKTKENLIQFVGKNILEVMKTEGWKRSMKEANHNELMADLLLFFGNTNRIS